MTRKTLIWSIAFAVLAVAAMGFMPGCGGGGGGTTVSAVPTGSASFTFKIPGYQARAAGRGGAKIPSSTYSVTVEAYNDAMEEPMETTVADLQETNTVTLDDIPVGDTVFKVMAYDSDGSPVATTMEIAPIEDGVLTTLYAELGLTISSSVATPSAITLAAGETLNVKIVDDNSAYSLSIPGTDCLPTSLEIGFNGQFACTFTTAGTYSLMSSGSSLATITVTSSSSTFTAANASAGSGYGAPPLAVDFVGDGVCSACSGTFTYSWDFDDGSTSGAQNPIHTFTAAGLYEVLLTVTDANGNTATDRVNIMVEQLPAPEVTSVSPSSGGAGESLTITGANFQSGATVTIGGTPATYASVSSSTTISAMAPEALAAGAHDVTVTNPDGQSGTLSGGFTVASASSYSASAYFPIASGDARTYYYAPINASSNTGDDLFTEAVLGTETVNGTECTMLGENSSSYQCFTQDTEGMKIHKEVSDHTQNGSTIIETTEYNPPLLLVPASIELGQSYTNSTTASFTESGSTTTETLTVTSEVEAVEDVYTPAGLFNGCVKLVMNFQTATKSDQDIFWLAENVGMVKNVSINPDDTVCGTEGCVEILKTATVNSQSYPSTLSSTGADGDYFTAYIGADASSAFSGYTDMTISGTSGTRSGVYGHWSQGSLTDSGSMTIVPYSNGTFGVSEEASLNGILSDSGVGVMTNLQASYWTMEIMAKKGSSYTQSMMEGDYYAVTFTIETDGTTATEFGELNFTSAGTYSYTATRTSSTEFQLATTNSGSFTFNSDGTFSIAGDTSSYRGMIGENGNILLYAKYDAGEREITYMVKKGSGINMNSSSGGFMGVGFGKDSSYYSALQYMDIKTDGTVDQLFVSYGGDYSAESAVAAVDTYGLVTASPNSLVAVNREQNMFVVSDQDTDDQGVSLMLRMTPQSQ